MDHSPTAHAARQSRNANHAAPYAHFASARLSSPASPPSYSLSSASVTACAMTLSAPAPSLAFTPVSISPTSIISYRERRANARLVTMARKRARTHGTPRPSPPHKKASPPQNSSSAVPSNPPPWIRNALPAIKEKIFTSRTCRRISLVTNATKNMPASCRR